MTGDLAHIYPDFVMMAAAFGVPARRVVAPGELRGAIREALDTPGPFLLDVMVPHVEHVLPMIPVRMRIMYPKGHQIKNYTNLIGVFVAELHSASGLPVLLGALVLQLEVMPWGLLTCVGLWCAQGGGSFKDIISTGSGKDRF